MPDAGARWKRGSPGVLLVLAAVVVAARAVTFGNPVIGFDEQFYLLVGDRMLQGAVPYVDIFDRKPIGLFLIYAGARLLGGNGFVQYKLVALLTVVATAYRMQRLARLLAPPVAATGAAVLYILWLDFMEGEGGQAEVFHALPMVLAAGATWRATSDPASRRRAGVVAMLAVGVALQIKYSVVFEGGFFGGWLAWRAWRDGERGWRFLVSVALWAGCAILPTLLAFVAYAAMGHAREWLFANFLSALAQQRRPVTIEVQGLAGIVLILSPLLVWAVIGRAKVADAVRNADPGAFLVGWLVAATAGLLLYGRFDSPHYAIPVLLPATVLLAPALATDQARKALFAAAGLALLAGQVVLRVSEARKGGSSAAAAVALAARPAHGCIYVYDGYPALYMLTHSCLPTRWPFPGHLNTVDEASPKALGVDPTVEVGRILATRPPAIVDDAPSFAFGNRQTRALLQQTLARHYRLAARIPTGPHRFRLVYRLREDRVSGRPG